MANTRQSEKRARQTNKRQTRNQEIRSMTHTALRNAILAVKNKDLDKAKVAYNAAIRALSKAASKGALPRGRAARKISRLTLLIKKSLPAVLTTPTAKTK